MSSSPECSYTLCNRLSKMKEVVEKNMDFFEEALGDWMRISDEKVAKFKSLLEIDGYAVRVEDECFCIIHRENIGIQPRVIMDINDLQYDTWVSIPWG